MNLSQSILALAEQSPEQWLQRASQRLPGWVALAAALLLGWYLARIAWALLPPAEWQWLPPPAPAATERGMANARDYSGLVAAHLFGEPSAEAAPALADVVDAPETRLNLELRAAVAANDPKLAHAIIADGSGKEQVYFLRDPIPGGAVLQQVLPDRVILNRGGVLEALRLPREFSAPPPRQARNRAGGGSLRPTVQQLVQQNTNRFTDIVRPQPFMPNGQLRGYRIYPGRNRQQFAALGLRPGDLVTEINGMALNNPAQGMEIFRSLGTATQLTLTLERNGQTEVVNLDTTQLATASGTQ